MEGHRLGIEVLGEGWGKRKEEGCKKEGGKQEKREK